MKPYLEISGHHIGKSHVLNGLNCEDYSLDYSDESLSFIAISDGHGDKNCFRSDRGARYACEIALHLCKDFQRITSHIDNVKHCDFERLIISLETEIADKWKAMVLSDVQDHPFLEKEILSASPEAQEVYRSGSRLEKAYGCTLIIAMCTEKYWLSCQIGDGKCIAAFRDGVFVEPIPIDENCLGNRSTSLCNSNAKDSFRHYYSSERPLAVFVSSDGIEESFDQAGLYNCFYSIGYWLKESGFDETKKKVDDLLPQISEGGSGDDVSLAVMASTEASLSKPRQTLDQIYEKVNAYSSSLEQCTVLLADAKDRLAEKEKEKAVLDLEIEELKASLLEREEKKQQIETVIDELQDALKERAERFQHASEQMEKATKYKAAAEKYWFAELEKLGLNYPISEVEDTSKKESESNIDNESEGIATSQISQKENNPSVIQDVYSIESTQPEQRQSSVLFDTSSISKNTSQEKRPVKIWPFSRPSKN